MLRTLHNVHNFEALSYNSQEIVIHHFHEDIFMPLYLDTNIVLVKKTVKTGILYPEIMLVIVLWTLRCGHYMFCILLSYSTS